MSLAYDYSRPYLPEDIIYGYDLVWQDRVGYARVFNFPHYVVTSEGDVISLMGREPKYLKQWTTNKGHLYVDLSQNGTRTRMLVHRLVADAFLPNPNHYEVVRHLNNIPTDNYLSNLAWGTYKDNRNDMIKNEHDYRKGVYCFENGKHYRTCREAAYDLDVSPSAITQCCQGKISHVNKMHLCYEENYAEKSTDTSWMTINNNYKPIVAIDKDGNRKRYGSRVEAAEDLGIPACGISSVISGHLKHTHGWKFEEG